jgi:DNA-binding NtrC family response regulator
VTDNLRAPSSILVVEPSAEHREFLETMLVSAGFEVFVAELFYEGRAFLESRAADLVVTELRLGEYNGLHLVMRAQSLHPGTAAIVMSDWVDPVLQTETERLRATFVPKPVTREDFLAVIARTCFRGVNDDTLIRPPFERRHIVRRTSSLPVDLEVNRRRMEDRRRNYALNPSDAVVSG